MGQKYLQGPTDHRKSGLGPNDVGGLTLGLARIGREVVEPDARAHDTKFLGFDDTWQRLYKLFNHLVRMGNVSCKVCKDLRFTEYEAAVAEYGGRFHDTGKFDERCINYRLTRALTDDEHAGVGKHAEFSGLYLESFRNQIRKEDHAILDDVIEVARYHHKPYKVADPSLRKVAYVVKVADAFVTMQEDRGDKLGMSTERALAALDPLDFILREQDPNHIPYLEFMDRCVASLRKLYGLNLE